MSTLEIKKMLIRKIKSLDNKDLLVEVYHILDIEKEEFDTLVLNNEQKKSILQGEKDIQNGKFLTDEEANEDIEKWLKE